MSAANECREALVYFIQSEQTRAIKIGVSNNPKKRLTSLQTANGNKLVLLGITSAHRESELHSRFKEFRLNGEWFAPDQPLLDFLAELGFKPLPKQKIEPAQLGDEHPYWKASKLVSGEWYGGDDIELLLGKFAEDCKCEAEDDDEDEDCGCDGCVVSKAFDRIEEMCCDEDIDGVIYNEDERIICIVFKRDVFGRRADHVRHELSGFYWDMDIAGITLMSISWTETGGFRLEMGATQEIATSESEFESTTA